MTSDTTISMDTVQDAARVLKCIGHPVRLRIVALDRTEPTELWAFETPAGSIWNNDWDGNPTVIDDLLFEDERLPPKAVLGVAAKFAIGHLLGPGDFSGGEGLQPI